MEHICRRIESIQQCYAPKHTAYVKIYDCICYLHTEYQIKCVPSLILTITVTGSLNAQRAADLPPKWQIGCSFHVFFICCRGPPFVCIFQKFKRTGGAAMRYKNNGQGEDNILQNQFTAYLVTAIRWRKSTYLKKRIRIKQYEFSSDFDNTFAQALETPEETAASLEQLALDSIMLTQALGQISDRERYIFFARALERRSFQDLALELGLGYKGVAAIYYRALQKLKKEL